LRKLGKKWNTLIIALSISLVVFHFYTAGFGILSDLLQRALHLGMVLPLCFLLKPATKKSPVDRVPFYDVILAILSVLCAVFIISNYDAVLWKPLRWHGFPDKYLAVILVLLIFEGSRRCVGWTFPIMGTAFFVYAYWGPLFPGMWGHKRFEIDFIMQSLYHTTTGIWGAMVGISAGMLAMFSIFGAVLGQTGGAGTFIQIGQTLTGKATGGPGKVAVVSSSLFGMISGSSMANVLATGTFTIPLMKKSGYTPEWAAAIEAVSSTGGQIMPPIMGSAAFIMAQMLGINYLTIAVAAFVPALLYYCGAFVAVHYVSKRHNIVGKGSTEKISISEISIIFIPIVVFLAYLTRGYSVINSAFYSTIAAVVISFCGLPDHVA
jgi:TRAP transporter 4TM/12TM fusion protein